MGGGGGGGRKQKSMTLMVSALQLYVTLEASSSLVTARSCADTMTPPTLCPVFVSRRSQHLYGNCSACVCRAQELCERRGGLLDLPVLNNPYGFCGRRETFQAVSSRVRALDTSNPYACVG